MGLPIGGIIGVGARRRAENTVNDSMTDLRRRRQIVIRGPGHGNCSRATELACQRPRAHASTINQAAANNISHNCVKRRSPLIDIRNGARDSRADRQRHPQMGCAFFESAYRIAIRITAAPGNNIPCYRCRAIGKIARHPFAAATRPGIGSAARSWRVRRAGLIGVASQPIIHVEAIHGACQASAAWGMRS